MPRQTSLITCYPIAVAAAVVWTLWLVLMITGDRWHLFADRWFMSVTMAFGSFIAAEFDVTENSQNQSGRDWSQLPRASVQY
jgi:hypothetical protein